MTTSQNNKQDKDNKMVMNLLAIQLLDKLVDKKAIFGAYQGGIFGTFNGVQKVMTKQIEYQYDEDNFDYSEIETETEEDIPVFTLGFASERTDLCEMVLQDLSRLTSRIEKKELRRENEYLLILLKNHFLIKF